MRKIPIQQVDNLVFVDRRHEPRIIVSIPGRYVLTNRRDAHGNRREFACRVVNISLHAMTFVAPVNGEIGERVITYCDEFGKLEGLITRVLDRGFVIKIAATDEERTKLATKIDWYAKNKDHDMSESRGHKRIVPKNPHSTLFFDDGSVLGCFVIDVSVSGVAVSADIKPKIGTPLAVGELLGRVVRHLDDGFAVSFNNIQDIGYLEQGLIRPLKYSPNTPESHTGPPRRPVEFRR
jgi:hypothetical protein